MLLYDMIARSMYDNCHSLLKGNLDLGETIELSVIYAWVVRTAWQNALRSGLVRK